MGKVVLISGSSSGIGLETAKLFASAGWTVIAGMRNAAGRTTPLHDDRRIIVAELDVTDTTSVTRAVAEVVKNHGGIDVLVNNAGYALTGVFEYFDEATVRKQIDTNVIGLMKLTREVLPHMRERGGGTIVNIASIAGKTTFPFYSFYHATKFAVEGFSESLQHELVPFNIKVKIVEPGPVKTDFFTRSMEMFKPLSGDDYSGWFDTAFRNMGQTSNMGISAKKAAKKVFKAATSSGWKLRYPVGSMGVLLLRRLMPDTIFNGLVRSIVFRGFKKS